MNALTIQEQKNNLRRRIKQTRNAIPENKRQAYSEKITQSLKNLDAFKNAKSILAFASFGSEISTSQLIEGMLVQGKRVYLPKVSKNGVLTIHPIDSASELKTSAYGIPEPTSERCEIHTLDLIITPGLAFDNRGYRLGYGMGYYDRLLTNIQGLKLALAFECQRVAEVPVEKHDQILDYLLTEKALYDFSIGT